MITPTLLGCILISGDTACSMMIIRPNASVALRPAVVFMIESRGGPLRH
jgi:hypothetical protein